MRFKRNVQARFFRRILAVFASFFNIYNDDRFRACYFRSVAAAKSTALVAHPEPGGCSPDSQDYLT